MQWRGLECERAEVQCYNGIVSASRRLSIPQAHVQWNEMPSTIFWCPCYCKRPGALSAPWHEKTTASCSPHLLTPYPSYSSAQGSQARNLTPYSRCTTRVEHLWHAIAPHTLHMCLRRTNENGAEQTVQSNRGLSSGTHTGAEAVECSSLVLDAHSLELIPRSGHFPLRSSDVRVWMNTASTHFTIPRTH